MSQNNTNTLAIRYDFAERIDPRIAPGFNAVKGALFRYVPNVGLPDLLFKKDGGTTTNWATLQTSDNAKPAFVYYVALSGAQFTSIQAALDQAQADGAGVGGQKATVYVAPGTYTENLNFRDGVSIIGMTAPGASPGVQITGNHVYTMSPHGDSLEPAIILQALLLANPNPADTIVVNGTPADGGFFQVQGCFFSKTSTGRCIFFNAPNLIGIVAQTAIINSPVSTDPMIESQSQVCVVNQCSNTAFCNMPLLKYTGAGSVNMFFNQVLGTMAYLVDIQSGQVFDNGNWMGTFGVNPDGIKVGAGVTYYCTNSTLIVSAGTGYAWQGTGTLNGTLIAYGINSNKDPGLTFNLLTSDS